MLILVRHGESEHNAKKLLSGITDVGLTDLGRAQARECGASIAPIEIDYCFTSALKRASDTADLMIEAIGTRPRVRHMASALNERSYGLLEGLTLGECRKKFPPKKYKSWERDYFEAPPMGEAMVDVACRVIPFYTHNVLPRLREGKTVLMVTHSNVIKVLLGFIRKLDENAVFDIEVENALAYTIPPHALNLKGSCAA